MINAADVSVRIATIDDGSAIGDLFSENGINQYGWDRNKWEHHYIEYPEGEAYSLVAEAEGKIVGHYGMVPICIGGISAMLGQHAYVSTEHRGLTVISALMKKTDMICQDKAIRLICGFANADFAFIKKTFFKWKTPFWLDFKKAGSHQGLDLTQSKFSFSYSDAWFEWRFGESRECYVSKYIDSAGLEHKQLLKTRGELSNEELIYLADSERWSQAGMHSKQVGEGFMQPFSVKIYDLELIKEGILNKENWKIDMGDSDTFTYKPWSGEN